jgi:hypothetical protein
MLRRAFAPLSLVVLVIAVSPTSTLIAQGTVDVRAAAASALAQSAYDEWLGPATPAVREPATAPLFDPPGAMSVESRVAYDLARTRFAHVAVEDRPIADGIAWYLQSRVVERAFDRTFRRPGYRFQSLCFFDCNVRWPLPLIVSRWYDGVGRPEYLRSLGLRRWPELERRLPDGVGVEAVRAAMLFASLERELGWPTLQGALRAVAESRDGRRVIDILEAATARPLRPALALARGSQPIDYAVSALSSAAGACGTTPCVATRVALARTGEVPYPLTLRLHFADRASVSTYWRGEAEMTFESAAEATVVSLDEGRAWLLDADFSNNHHETVRTTNVAVTKFVARWMMWLQDAMLTYSFPI